MSSLLPGRKIKPSLPKGGKKKKIYIYIYIYIYLLPIFVSFSVMFKKILLPKYLFIYLSPLGSARTALIPEASKFELF